MKKTVLAEAERNPFDGKPRQATVRIRRATMDGEPVEVKAPEEGTMRIKLNRDYTVCLDGIHPTTFRAGQEAETPERIAAVLLEDGRASLPKAAKTERKMEEGAPKNKMLDGAPDDKGGDKKKG